MSHSPHASGKTLLQYAAISCMIVFWAMLLHKGFLDVSALALKHSGESFWPALLRYFLRNMAGG
jgi:hypothetical protein